MKRVIFLIMYICFLWSCNLTPDIVTNGTLDRAIEVGELVPFAWEDPDTGDGRYYNFYYAVAGTTDGVLVGSTDPDIKEFAFDVYSYLTTPGDYIVGVSAVEGTAEGKIHWSSDDTSLTAKAAVFYVDEDLTVWLYSNVSGLTIYSDRSTGKTIIFFKTPILGE